MSTYDTKTVQRLALRKGDAMSSLYFIKSKEVAERIARDAEAYLKRHGVTGKGRGDYKLVKVMPDERWVGTWTVEVAYPLVTWSPLTRNQRRNQADSDLAAAALRASYKPSDLVSSWTAV